MATTRIVAADDDRRILRVLKRACESVGYEFHAVLDVGFFPSACDRFRPALVFLDLNLDGVDGAELLRFLARAHPEVTVVVTSGVDEQLLRSAQALGLSLGLRMLEPIKKPLMVADIRRRLKTFHAPPAAEEQRTIGEAELGTALRTERIEVVYQPVVRLADRGVLGVEALARIRRDDGTVVPPAQFIPLAERTGRVAEITMQVLGRALDQLARWHVARPDLKLCVNVSPRLLEDAGFAQRAAVLLQSRQIAADRLIVEIPAQSFRALDQPAAETLQALRALGVTLALDDFGAGTCSLGQLYEFPFELLKLDRSFAIRARTSRDAAAMIRSSLDLARSMDLTVVAEGIQDAETLAWLTELGCHAGQGFHISPPMSASAVGDWMVRTGPLPPGPTRAIAV